jgi:prephenate dehydratase
MVSVQGDVNVAFQGDSGAFSQSAARIFFTDHGADNVNLKGFSTFDDVFAAVRDEKVQCV